MTNKKRLIDEVILSLRCARVTCPCQTTGLLTLEWVRVEVSRMFANAGEVLDDSCFVYLAWTAALVRIDDH